MGKRGVGMGRGGGGGDEERETENVRGHDSGSKCGEVEEAETRSEHSQH